jgi:hypothetical protein
MTKLFFFVKKLETQTYVNNKKFGLDRKGAGSLVIFTVRWFVLSTHRTEQLITLG